MKTKQTADKRFPAWLPLVDPDGAIAKTHLIALWAMQRAAAPRRQPARPWRPTLLDFPEGKDQAERLIEECLRSLQHSPEAAKALFEYYFSPYPSEKAQSQQGIIAFIRGEYIWYVTYRQRFTFSGDTKRMQLDFRRRDKGLDESVFAGSEEIRLVVRDYTKVSERPFQIHYTRRVRGRTIRRLVNTVAAVRAVEHFLVEFPAAAVPDIQDSSRLN